MGGGIHGWRWGLDEKRGRSREIASAVSADCEWGGGGGDDAVEILAMLPTPYFPTPNVITNHQSLITLLRVELLNSLLIVPTVY
jgi:hypothetical protein